MPSGGLQLLTHFRVGLKYPPCLNQPHLEQDNKTTALYQVNSESTVNNKGKTQKIIKILNSRKFLHTTKNVLPKKLQEIMSGRSERARKGLKIRQEQGENIRQNNSQTGYVKAKSSQKSCWKIYLLIAYLETMSHEPIKELTPAPCFN